MGRIIGIDYKSPEQPVKDTKEADFELLETQNLIRQLTKACESALRLRGMFGAIIDPLNLESEKQYHRVRYQAIEKQIAMAIESADDFMQAGK